MLPDAHARKPTSWSCWLIVVVVFFLASLELARHQAEAASIYKTTTTDPHNLQLCSRNLSDALYLICKDRGFNGPFSSSETDARPSAGGSSGGLVEECCYRSCTYEQMEQYCKPAQPKTN